MSTSAFDRSALRPVIGCILASAACAAVSAVYQAFGYGVTSMAMSLAFVVPLVGGALHLLLWMLVKHPAAQTPTARLWQGVLFCGLATVAAGLYFQGVVEIAGVDGGWETWFYIAGACVSLLGTAGLWRTKGGRHP